MDIQRIGKGMVSATLDKELAVGLRREVRNPRSGQFVTQAQNVRATQEGLEGITLPYNPFSVSISWPFPQLIRGREVTLLCTETSIYTVDESTSPWTTTLVVTYDATNLSSTKSIVSGGGAWHFIDFGTSWVLINTANTVYRTGVSVTGRWDSSKVCVYTGKPLLTGCGHRKRAILGGMTWGSDWETLFSTWLSSAPSSVNKTFTLQDNVVFYTEVGAGSLFGLLVDSDWANEGVLAEDIWAGSGASNSRFMQSIKSLDLGWVPMGWQGNVLQVRPMGNTVMVYGESGATILGMDGPLPGYRKVKEFKIGCLSRTAAGGDDERQVWIDPAYNLWMIDAAGQTQRLGYQEYLEQITGTVAIAYNAEQKEFYIGDSETSFLLTEIGLTETKAHVTSGYTVSNRFVGAFEPFDGTDEEILIETDALDFGNRMMKRIDRILLGMELRPGALGAFSSAFSSDYDVMQGNAAYVRLKWRNSGQEEFRATSWKKVNPSGWVSIPMKAVEIKVCVKMLVFNESRLERITVWIREQTLQ